MPFIGELPLLFGELPLLFGELPLLFGELHFYIEHWIAIIFIVRFLPELSIYLLFVLLLFRKLH